MVTGSSGMLGTDLCDSLSKKHEVVGIDIKEGNCPTHMVSITDAVGVQSVFERESPDVVIHTAAWTDVDGCEQDREKARDINVKGTEAVAESASVGDIPVVAISTDFVFDGTGDSPYTEDEKPGPISFYGRTKYEAEGVIQARLARYAIVRTSWLYGKGGRNFIEVILAKAKAGEDLKVVDDQTGSPTYTRDLSVALERLLDTDLMSGREIFHVSNSGQCTWYGFARSILDSGGFPETVIEPITSDELGRPARRPRYSVLDNTKFNKASGYSMRPWREAVEEYLKDEAVRIT